MTLQDIFNYLGENPIPVLIYFTLMPLTAIIAGIMSKNEGHESPWCFLYSALIYATCVPGIFALTLTGYTFFFERQSFLRVNVLVYFLPIVIMIATLLLINRNVDMRDIPGFNKLSGLLMVIFACFFVMFILQRMHIFTVFFGSIWHLFGLFIVLFAVFKFGADKLFAGKGKDSRGKELDF